MLVGLPRLSGDASFMQKRCVEEDNILRVKWKLILKHKKRQCVIKSLLLRGDWSASRPGYLTPGKEPPVPTG
jgi:hypothetical protein